MFFNPSLNARFSAVLWGTTASTTNTMVVQVALLKVFLQTSLLVGFLYFFGVPSFLRYQEGKEMVVVRKTDSGGIPAPAVTVCARKEDELVSDACNGSANVFSCRDEESWAVMSKVVLDAGKGESPNIKDLMAAKFWNLQIRSRYECFTFSMDDRIGSDYLRDIIRFIINKKTRVYDFYIHDEDYFFPNLNHHLLPINRMKVFPRTDCGGVVSISLSEKHELNTPEDPCKESKEYNFRQCVEQSVARRAGCQNKQACVSAEQYR